MNAQPPTVPEAPGGAARASRGLLGAAGGVAGLTLLSRALGFARWIVQATTVGAGTVAGAYATANQVPNVLYEVVVGGALAATIVPLLASAVGSGRSREASRTASGLLGAVLLVLVPLGVLLAALAGPIAGLFPVSQGVDPALQHALVADFLRMFALQVPLYGIGVVLTGVLQAHGSFTWPAITPIASSLVVMAAYGVYSAMTRGGDPQGAAALEVLGWGTTLGVAALSLPLAWPVHRLGIRLRPSLRLDRGVARRALRLGSAGVLTLLAQQVSVLTVLALARSGGSTGTVAVYQYTQAVYVLPYAVLAVPVATVVYPRLAAAFGEAGDGSAADQARAAGSPSPARPGAPAPVLASTRARFPSPAAELAGRSTALVTAAALAGAALLLGASDAAERFFALLAEVDGMGLALAVMAPGVIGYSLIFQVTRALYAADRAREAAHATAAGWLTTAAASWLAVRLLAPDGGDARGTLLGLAIGLTAGMTVAGIGLLGVLATRLGREALSSALRVLMVGGPVAAVAGLGARALSRSVGGTALGIALGALGGLLAALLVLAAVHLADRGLIGVLLPRRAARRAPASPRSRSRVLLVSGSAAGGVRAHLAECARLLSGAGHDVVVEAPASVLAGSELGGARSEPLEIGPRPSPGDLLAVARLRRLARRADVVHAHGLRAGALAALAVGRRRTGRTRLAVTLHNVPVGGPATRAIGSALERVVASRADRVLGVSPDLVERMMRLGARDAALATIPAPAREPRGEAGGGSAVGPRHGSLPWPDGAARVLTVARLAPQKGIGLLLDAAAALAAEGGGGLAWVVAGDGPERGPARERVRDEHLPVLLVGRREDVEELMGAADVVVQTSLWEGQPLTVQEALRAGVALVATDVGGTAVTARGGAVLVPPNAEAIAAAVGRLLADDAERAAQCRRAREAADTLPGPDELLAQLEEILLAR